MFRRWASFLLLISFLTAWGLPLVSESAQALEYTTLSETNESSEESDGSSEETDEKIESSYGILNSFQFEFLPSVLSGYFFLHKGEIHHQGFGLDRPPRA